MMHRRHWVPALIGIVLSLVATACTQTIPLPTVATADRFCREIGYEGVLRGDPADPRVAWGEKQTRVNHLVLRKELVWPPGYTARFTPELEILDASRRVRLVAGDVIEGGCVGGSGGELYVIEE
jgi:hypothetical protein